MRGRMIHYALVAGMAVLAYLMVYLGGIACLAIALGICGFALLDDLLCSKK